MWILGIFGCIVAIIILINIAESIPVTCPKCKKVFVNFKVRSDDYHTAYYCPYCNREL